MRKEIKASSNKKKVQSASTDGRNYQVISAIVVHLELPNLHDA